MNWIGIIGTVLEIVLIILKEWLARKNAEVSKIEKLQKKRLALLDALADSNSGWISRNSYDRAFRLRLLLDRMRKDRESSNGA